MRHHLAVCAQYASPATISRCGMVYVDSRNLGYKPFVWKWINSRKVRTCCALLPAVLLLLRVVFAAVLLLQGALCCTPLSGVMHLLGVSFLLLSPSRKLRCALVS